MGSGSSREKTSKNENPKQHSGQILGFKFEEFNKPKLLKIGDFSADKSPITVEELSAERSKMENYALYLQKLTKSKLSKEALDHYNKKEMEQYDQDDIKFKDPADIFDVKKSMFMAMFSDNDMKNLTILAHLHNLLVDLTFLRDGLQNYTSSAKNLFTILNVYAKLSSDLVKIEDLMANKSSIFGGKNSHIFGAENSHIFGGGNIPSPLELLSHPIVLIVIVLILIIIIVWWIRTSSKFAPEGISQHLRLDSLATIPAYY